MDSYDLRILDALQQDGSMTNNALSEVVHLSASQCSRRRAALEADGVIEKYQACLNAEKLGMTLHAIVRLNLKSHDSGAAHDMFRWLEAQPEVQSAFSVSGDADFILSVRTRDLQSFSNFLHDRLLIRPQISQVRSEFVLKTLKNNAGLDLSAIA